jgi:hypothetical protein
MEAVVSPHSGQGSGGRPVAGGVLSLRVPERVSKGKPHAGKSCPELAEGIGN